MIDRPLRSLLVLALVTMPALGCKKTTAAADAGASASATPVASVAPSASPVATMSALPAQTPAAQAVPIPPGSPPPDGKYERVLVNGVTVPMVQVMNGGSIVLVDTDGKKPRTWEEQYKRKRPTLKPGEFDLHKTDTNKNDSFEDDAIDEGRWVIDAKGNVTKG